MMAVMRNAIQLDDTVVEKEAELFSRLSIENQVSLKPSMLCFMTIFLIEYPCTNRD